MDRLIATTDPALLAQLEALRRRPGVQAMLERQERLARRGPIPFAFVEPPLPDGVVAIVHLGRPEPLGRYAIVSARTFDDGVYLRAMGAEFAFLMEHEDDDSAVTITVHANGTVEYDSPRNGHRTTTSGGQVADRRRTSGPMLERLRTTAVQHIPGVGDARVVMAPSVA